MGHQGLNSRRSNEYLLAVADKIKKNRKGITVQHVNKFYDYMCDEQYADTKVTQATDKMINLVYKNIFCEAVKTIANGYGVDEMIIRLYNEEHIKQILAGKSQKDAHHRMRSLRSKYVGLNPTRQNVIFTGRKKERKLLQLNQQHLVIYVSYNFVVLKIMILE